MLKLPFIDNPLELLRDFEGVFTMNPSKEKVGTAPDIYLILL